MPGCYVHVPFCSQKCHYCDFVIALSAGGLLHPRFLTALEREARHAAGEWRGGALDTLYLGGGTPSVLSNDEARALFTAIRAHFTFKTDAEITIEVNPGDVSSEKAALYASLGVNRVSLGAQSFHDRTLKTLNRKHSAKDIGESFALLRRAGIRNISLDLILSLPGETLTDVQKSLWQAVELEPEHLSLYELSVEPKTRFGEELRRGTLGLPGEDEQLDMLEDSREFLKEAGYRHYELLSYARPGFESRHNSLYWTGGECIGLGPGASSYVGGKRSRMAATVDRYYQKAESGDFVPDEEEALTGLAKQREAFLLALRLEEGAKTGDYPELLPAIEADVASFCRDGLLVRGAGRVRLTPKGQLFAETVFAELSL